MDEQIAIRHWHILAIDPLSADPDIRRKFVDLRIDTDAARVISYEVADMQARGEIPNKEASMSKTLGTTLVQIL